MEKRRLNWDKLDPELCKICKHRLDCLTEPVEECKVSYIRYGHPLTWFKDESHSYVFVSDEGVVDYDDCYEHLPTLIELIGNIIARETEDEGYAHKMVLLLSKRLGVEDQLRDSPLSTQEYFQILAEMAERGKQLRATLKDGEK